MDHKILFVDDDANILSGYRRSLRRDLNVEIANGPEEGLEKIKTSGPYSVVISDYRMPNMTGVEFLTRVKKDMPDAVRVILSGQADFDAAVKAINEGDIYRFVHKPCPKEDLLDIIKKCLRQYELITSEKVLLQETLKKSSEVLLQILSIVDPITFSRSNRISNVIKSLRQVLQLKDGWMYELAGLLSQIGTVSLDPDTVKDYFSKEIPENETIQEYQKHPEIAVKLLESVPRLEPIVKIIESQYKRYEEISEKGKPLSEQTNIVIGVALLKVANDYERHNAQQCRHEDILKKLSFNKSYYAPEALSALEAYCPLKEEKNFREIKVKDLQINMTIVEDICNKSGMLLIPKGEEVNHAVIAKLQSFARRQEIEDTIVVYIN